MIKCSKSKIKLQNHIWNLFKNDNKDTGKILKYYSKSMQEKLLQMDVSWN